MIPTEIIFVVFAVVCSLMLAFITVDTLTGAAKKN